MTGTVNGDGTATLYAVTSTVSASVDQGADPNQLVTITDNLAFNTAPQAATESFSVLRSARYGEVLRGVAQAGAFALAPSVALYASNLGGHVQKLTVRNTSSTPMPGPIVVALDDLPPSVVLANANGVTSTLPPFGSPYVVIPGTAGGLAPGQAAIAGLVFRDGPASLPSYDLRILSGTPTP